MEKRGSFGAIVQPPHHPLFRNGGGASTDLPENKAAYPPNAPGFYRRHCGTICGNSRVRWHWELVSCPRLTKKGAPKLQIYALKGPFNQIKPLFWCAGRTLHGGRDARPTSLFLGTRPKPGRGDPAPTEKSDETDMLTGKKGRPSGSPLRQAGTPAPPERMVGGTPGLHHFGSRTRSIRGRGRRPGRFRGLP